MAWVQFFQKTNNNIEEYKKNLLEWLTLALENSLLEKNIFEIIKKHLLSQKKYIEREDTKKYLWNIKLILQEINLKNNYIKKIKYLKIDNELQYWYEKVSIANDICTEWEKEKQEEQKRINFESKQKLEKQKEEKEKKQELKKLEDIFNEL
jgi:hypothetical protein